MKLRKNRFRNQSGFISTKAILATGALLTASIAGVATYAGVISSVPSTESSGDSDVCVSAFWNDDTDINAQKGCGPGYVAIPPEENNGDEDSSSVTYKCGPSELIITKAMQDHSDSNKDLDPKDMTPYPDGGWSVILKASEVDPSFSGVLMTIDGDFIGIDSLVNSSGPAMLTNSGEDCGMSKVLDGKFHSTEGPAVINVHAEADYPGYTEMTYMVEGVTYRENGPAIESFYTDGSKREASWFSDGKVHRVGEPAIISHREDGSISSETWMENGNRHKINGAATINYHPNKQVSIEKWYVDGVWHRSDGPAWIEYKEDGSVLYKSYYLNNKGYSGSRDLWITDGGDPTGWPL